MVLPKISPNGHSFLFLPLWIIASTFGKYDQPSTMKYTFPKLNLLCEMKHTPFFINSRLLHTDSHQLVETYFWESADFFINPQCSKSTLGWDESIQQLMSKKELTTKRNFLYKIFKPYDFSRDFPDDDSDATENFYTNFPDEDPILDTWNTNEKHLSDTINEKQSLPNEKHLSDTTNEKLSLPDNHSTCDLFPNFFPRGSK